MPKLTTVARAAAATAVDTCLAASCLDAWHATARRRLGRAARLVEACVGGKQRAGQKDG